MRGADWEAPSIAREVEEEELYYESLDRVLSSSSSSTSASDDDADHRHHRRSLRGASLLPPLSSSYDVWISEPSSVEERRNRLLLQMGLGGDPALALARPKSPSRDAAGSRTVEQEVGPSAVSFPDSLRSDVAVIVRSRSDGSVDPNCVRSERTERISLGSGPATDKPPLVGRSWSLTAAKCGGLEGGGLQQPCTIRNLDDGREFVVKEMRQDGMWNKLKEVGTGRQLTMEEFEIFVGRSPLVQELMRRQSVEESGSDESKRNDYGCGGPGGGLRAGEGSLRSKKKGSWLKSIKNIAGTVVSGGHHQRERRSNDERETSSEKGGRRSSSATDDSLDGSHSTHHGPERIRVRQYGKSYKELTGLYITQAIQAHNGAIWTIKFSLDGRLLASGGEDCVIHVWEVAGLEKKAEFFPEGEIGEDGNCHPLISAFANGTPEPAVALSSAEASHWEKKRWSKVPHSRRSVSSDHLMLPEHVFALLDKPIFSFRGHTKDVLDLSWSKSQHLLSSSMDKTVRLWDTSFCSCLKTFSHSDYVTCIQFNPVDEKYFISGSLDKKVRIWSIPDRQIVDWNDLHEIVTAVCFTPNGQAAMVGTHKGSCHLFDTSENKLHIKDQIYLQSNKNKSSNKKITGFQFVPGSSSEVLITSADSRIRVVNGVELMHKFKGFRNTSSQISASMTPNGKYVICASEDSHVYIWRYDACSQPSKAKGIVNSMQSYEHFQCQDVTVAVAWPHPSATGLVAGHSNMQNGFSPVSASEAEGQTQINNGHKNSSSSLSVYTQSPVHRDIPSRIDSPTWSKEKMPRNELSPQSSGELHNGALLVQSKLAWGMAIVTAGQGGEIRIYQNFGFPFRV
ncbi:uncharacterized protein LOC141838043 [Curcuma longa]|uniref:uncharacterized protein LOC141838043 n=1 Tax=Curcuma longa TaxID=136217 RepID=UPI003D9F774C